MLPSLSHGKMPILGGVHELLGVSPVFTSIQLIITISPDGKKQKYRLLERKFGTTTLN
jgi:hypothetical protein